MEIYRSRDGRWLVEHTTEYYVYDLDGSDEEEVFSCWRMDDLLDWLAARGVEVANLDEVDPGYRP